jgi:branched-chain amino acid transport system substrate-binding protein
MCSRLRTLGVVAALVAAAAGVMGCGSSDDNNGGSTSATTTGGSTQAAAGSSIDNALGAKYSGGTAGKKADGSPITIGWVNMQGGTVSNPEATVAVEAALKYLNEQQGGVGGHPLQLKTCFVASSEEEGQKCAQELLNDAAIDVVLQGGLNVGAQSLHQTIDGAKPVIITEANPGPDTQAKNTYALNSPALSFGLSIVPYLMSKGVKTVALITDTSAANVAITKQTLAPLKAAGIKTKMALFPPNSTDLVAPLTAAGATTADAVLPTVVTPPGCIALAKAAEQLNITDTLVAAELCENAPVKKALGDYPQWTYQSSMLNAHADDPTGQVPFYNAVMAKYAGSDAELSLNAPYAFSGAFALAQILNAAGPDNLSADSIAAAAKKFAGPTLMGPPKIAFGSIPPFPTLGSGAGRYYVYQGDGQYTPSDWVEPKFG